METPGFLIVLYSIYALPGSVGIEQLPWPNVAMAVMFVGEHALLHNPLTEDDSGNPLYLPVDHFCISKPQHVPDEPIVMDRCHILQYIQWAEYRWVACGVRRHEYHGMAR